MVLLAASLPVPPLLFTINALIEFCFLILLIIVSSTRSSASTSSRRREYVAPSGSKLTSFTTIVCGFIGLINLCTFLWMLYFFLEYSEAFNSYLIWVYFVIEAISWIVLAFTVNKGVERAAKIAIHAWWVTNLIINTATVVWAVRDIILGQALTIYSILSIAQWLASWFLISCLFKIRRQNSSQSSHLTDPLLGDEISSGRAISDLDAASFFDRATFRWLNPLLVLGYSKPLVQSDIPFLPRHDRTEIAAAAFLEALELQRKSNPSRKPSVWRALAQCYRNDLLFTGFLALIRTLSLSVTPLFLFGFVNNVAEGQSRAKGFIIIIGLFLTKVIQSFTQRHWSFQSRYIIAKSRSAVMAACYEKELRLSPSSKQRHAAGEILSYIGVDAYRLGEFLWWMHYMWVAVLQVLIALAIQFNIIGLAACSCIVVLFISAIIQIPVSRLLEKAQTNLMQAQDKRLRSITEILNSMKIIKLQSWENEFKAMVNEHRETELKWLWGMHSSRSYAGIVFWLTYVVGITSTLTVYALLGNEFTAAVIFTVFSAFANTQEPARMIPEIIAIFSQVAVSVRRLDIFLQDEEFAEGAVDKEILKGSDFAIRVTNASFSWDAEASNLTLKGISLHVKHGQKVAISGAVGSGKSSLLMTILGEIPKIDGSVQVNGRIAYVAQTAWIQSGTIKDNILFGRPMNEVKYKEVLHACALVQDIDNFPHGDLTEIGERGLNMSGGQKQRIQLARAVYNDADIYLLDDPFSAVDAQTAATLFNECVMKALSTKTVVLVTHQVEFLPAVDHILVLQEGEIQQAGQYDQLLQAGQVFEKLVNAHKGTLDAFNKTNSADEIQMPQKTDTLKQQKEDGNDRENDEALDIMSQLTTEELKEIGDVGIQPYRDYIVISKGFLLFILDVLGQGGQVSLQVMGGLWLAVQVMNPHINSTRLVGGYALFAYASSISFLVRLRVHVMLGVKGSRAFFSLLIDSIFKAPMGFFDATPTGRILSRVSSDMSLLDIDVIQISGILLAFLFDLPGVLIVLLWVKWEIIIVMIPLLYIVLRIERYYRKSSQEIMRLNAMTKAPIVNFSGETINGATTIRAFDMQQRFRQRNLELVDIDETSYVHTYGVMEWLILRVEMCGTLLLGIFGIILASVPGISSGLAGVGLAYGSIINISLVILTQWYCQLASSIVSIERIKQYMHIPVEAPAIIEDHRPPQEWPSEGQIQLQNLQIRYRVNSPLVLRGITCTFEGGQKVGVVGRTGSGKTTLISALFRLVEPAGGTIVIDGIDICSIGLHDLRTKLGIIPQEPTLFRGTVRTNLDPLGKYSDHEIWETLEKCQMGKVIRSMSNQLQSSVTDEGGNWSVGQRQLFCLGRVLLKRSRILVLDEATASIDSTTDAVLQRVIRDEFANCTVVTVAHRIPTVIDSDMVLALQDGLLAEFDPPARLLANSNSLFSKLVAEYWAQRSHKSSGDLSTLL